MPHELIIEHRKLKTKIIEDPGEILKYLHIGISIPIRPEFYKYILNDLNFFKANSLILIEKDEVVGHSLLFSDTKDILYFGFFGVNDHDAERIAFLLDKIVEFGKNKKAKSIHGPINIPTIIYGWGFMKEGSCEDVFIGRPVNPPMYQQLFLERGFCVKHELIIWEWSIFKFDPYKLKKFNFSDYEFFNPKNLNDFKKMLDIFLDLHKKNLPESAQLTPSVSQLFESYADFIFTYGYSFMISFVRYKTTGKIVACASFLPNPFQKDGKGNDTTIVANSWVVEPEHRRNGLVILMLGNAASQSWDHGIRIGSGPIPSANKANTEVAKRIGSKITGSRIILELNL